MRLIRVLLSKQINTRFAYLVKQRKSKQGLKADTVQQNHSGVDIMKYILVVGDGMADYPVPELGNKTPLQAAYKPNMDSIAAKGQSGLIKTVPDELNPGSETAICSLLGYDPESIARAEAHLKRLPEA